MPWNETDIMELKIAFVQTYLRGTVTMIDLCHDYQISRKTGYKWLGRYQSFGLEGLNDRDRRPHEHPNRLADEILQRCVALKVEKSSWGPKKLVALGRTRHPDLEWPAPSTLSGYLKRLGLVKRRRVVSRSVPPYVQAFKSGSHANEVWCADFKGQFQTGDKRYCYPLTVTDAHSRFVLCCTGLRNVGYDAVKLEFEKLFEEYGLPEAIRTDNGPPFSSVRLGFSPLSLWWRKLGIVHERIEPGHPEQNGQHERMHKTLKAETTRPPKSNMKTQQRRFNEWREEFNHERPHESLGQTTPASHYTASPRTFPKQIAAPSYPDDYEVRRIKSRGDILWNGKMIYASQMLAGELIGLQSIGSGKWKIWIGDQAVAVLDERLEKVLPMYPV